MNKVIIDGRLTADPVMSTKSDVPCVTFSVAVNLRSKGPDGQP